MRVVPWTAISKVEARLDNSVYVETYYVVRGRFKRYLLRPVVSAEVLKEHKSDPALAEAVAALRDPACIAWTWAQNFRALAALLGNEIAESTGNGDVSLW